jgi:hypothetical protein
MKILITADLHFREHWFRWLFEQAPDFDLVCIAGDLLDMFAPASKMAQAREVTRWLRQLADAVPVRSAPATTTMPDARLSLIWLPSTSGSWPLGWAIRSSPIVTRECSVKSWS